MGDLDRPESGMGEVKDGDFYLTKALALRRTNAMEKAVGMDAYFRGYDVPLPVAQDGCIDGSLGIVGAARRSVFGLHGVLNVVTAGEGPKIVLPDDVGHQGPKSEGETAERMEECRLKLDAKLKAVLSGFLLNILDLNDPVKDLLKKMGSPVGLTFSVDLKELGIRGELKGVFPPSQSKSQAAQNKFFGSIADYGDCLIEELIDKTGLLSDCQNMKIVVEHSTGEVSGNLTFVAKLVNGGSGSGH